MVLQICGVAHAQNNDVFTTSVMFPANFIVGDYIEFARAAPIAASASGYYEISVAYTRGGYYGSNSASHFGRMMPLISVQFVPI